MFVKIKRKRKRLLNWVEKVGKVNVCNAKEGRIIRGFEGKRRRKQGV